MPETPWARHRGADHPELGVLVEEARDVLVDAGGDDDLGQVLGDRGLLDEADRHVAEAHLGLAGLDAGGVLEDDLDQRPALGIGCARRRRAR